MPKDVKNSTKLKKHSLRLDGHTTSITLEDIFWKVLKDIARTQEKSVNSLVAEIDRERITHNEPSNLSSCLRVFVLMWLKQQA